MPKSFLHTSEDFEAFYRRHVQAIYRVCYAFMKNPQDAEDCTEDVFVRAMTIEVVFENERHERAWLTTTAMNLCKDRLKSWWKQKVVPMPASSEHDDADGRRSVTGYEDAAAGCSAAPPPPSLTGGGSPNAGGAVNTVGVSAHFDTPEAALERQLLRAQILSLPEKYKEVVWLYYYDGYQTDEIASMLHRPASTIRNQLRDARSKLKELLGGEDT